MPPLKARGGNLIEPSRHGSACGMSDERSVYGDLGGVVWLVWPGDELHLRTPPRRRHRWIGRRQPEVLKNGLDRAVFDEESEHHPATATAVALEHVLTEDPAQQLSPGQPGRRARSGICLQPSRTDFLAV